MTQSATSEMDNLAAHSTKALPAKETFSALTGLRFFAAIFVVLYHYSPEALGFHNLSSYVRNCIAAGPIALGFFYVLSGFVLAYAYADRLPDNKARRQSFWFARVARLYPVYLLAFGLFLPMAWEKYIRHPDAATNGHATFTLGGILSLLLVQSWTPLSQAWNGPGWSLSVEAFFYFLFPFVLVPLYRGPKPRVIATVLCLWLLMMALTFAHWKGLVSDALWHNFIQYQPLFWSPLFLIGITIYRFRRTSPFDCFAASYIAFGSAAALILLCALVPSAIDILIYGGAAPFIVLMLLTLSCPTAVASRVIGSDPLYKAGSVSYITYILQSPVWHVFQVLSNKFSHVSPTTAKLPNWQFMMFVMLLLALSFAVQAYVEKPAQRWLLMKRAEGEGRRMGQAH